MKNKNNLVLSIIAIVTILVTVVGATFAYFASTVNEGTGSALTTVVDENDVFFTATGSNMTMDITADKMTQHASKDGVIVAGDSSDSIMNVTLTTGTEGSIACNYNIYFQWENSSNAYLTKTTGATKEFTAQLALTDPNGNGSAGTNKFANETQLTDVVTTVNKTLVVEGASIVANASQSGSQSWTATIKFYNLQLNQTDLAGKTFKGKFTIDDVECASAISSAVDPNSLSGKVLAKVSDDDYTSSQDGSNYSVGRELAFLSEERLAQNEYVDISTTNGESLNDVGINYSNGRWNIPNATFSSYYLKLKLNSKNNLVCIGSDGDYNTSDVSLSVYVNSNPVAINLRPIAANGEGEMASSFDDHCEYINVKQNDIVELRIYTGGNEGDDSSVLGHFYINEIDENNIIDAGVRYRGLNPDNYITFNGDEEWRIIGVFEGSTIGLEPGKHYTEILSSNLIETSVPLGEDLEGCDFDWVNHDVKLYLNNAFLNSLVGKDKIAKYNDEYSLWYLRGGDSTTASEWYLSERVTGKPGYKDGVQYASDEKTRAAIGLLYQSDYLYSNGWIDGLDVNSSGIMTLTPYVDYRGGSVITRFGGACGAPTLYLEANLTATGTGTKLDPYVLN